MNVGADPVGAQAAGASWDRQNRAITASAGTSVSSDLGTTLAGWGIVEPTTGVWTIVDPEDA